MRVNKRQLSEYFGISERTLTDYQKDSTFPIIQASGRGGSNEYDTVEVFNWLMDRAKNAAAAAASRESAQDELIRVKTALAKLNYGKELEELVLSSQVKPALLQVALAIRTELLTGNSKLKAEIDTLYGIDTDIEILNEHSQSALRHLSDLGKESEQVNSGSSQGIRTATEAL